MFNKGIDLLHETGFIKGRQTHLRARLIVGLILLVCSALGVLLTDFAPEQLAWKYWVYITPIFAIICIVLSWIVSRNHDVSSGTVWREILHWIGLLCAMFIVSMVIDAGIISFLIGGLFMLILLALTIFLAGVHFDSMYLIIGIILGLLAIIQTLLVKYLTFVLIPIIIIAALLFLWRYRHSKKQRNEQQIEKTTKKHENTPDDEL